MLNVFHGLTNKRSFNFLVIASLYAFDCGFIAVVFVDSVDSLV
jgi:hypothetical protein